MALSIPLDFKTLCRPREDPDCDYTPSVLEFRDEQGQSRSIPIEVKIRGGWRSLTRNCSAPLLFLRFDQQSTTGTPFEEQSVLPLTTHCGRGLSLESAKVRQRRSTWEQYLLREYLAHRLFNLITPVSLNARLVRVTYPNPDKPSRKIVNYAFFTEHFESVARRTGGELLERGSFDHERLNARSASLVSLFQFLIGNTDWSITRERNIALIRAPGGSQLPLPFDFDMSGLVNAHYAGPAPTLPIESVRDRYYLGFCHPATDWEELFDTYLAQEYSMFDLVGEIPEMDKRSSQSVTGFLNQFFTILRSDELRNRQIVNHCQAWPPAPIDHTTPAEKR